MPRIPLSLPDDMYETLRKLSFSTHEPMAKHIRAAITEYLNKKEESPVTNQIQYRGIVKDDMRTLETKHTKWYPTYQEAHQAAEKLCKRTYGQRGSVDVENVYEIPIDEDWEIEIKGNIYERSNK